MRARSDAFGAAAVAAVGVAAAVVAAVDVAVAADVHNILRLIVVPRGDQYNCHLAVLEEAAGVEAASEDTESPSCNS